MSWCRWGSVCRNTIPEFEVDVACTECPGSDLYVYECVSGKFMCCCCLLSGDKAKDFECDTESEMNAHLLEHDRAGHHVRKSLLELARGLEPKYVQPWENMLASLQEHAEKRKRDQK